MFVNMIDDEAMTLRVTLRVAELAVSDAKYFQVIWRGMSIRRIRRTGDVSDAPQWVWNCYRHRRPWRYG